MKKYRITAVLLSLLLLLSILASCGSNNDPADDQAGNTSNDDANISSDDAQTETTEEAKITPDLPDSDFQGYKFTFLSHREESVDWVDPDPREILSESETGDPINDAVYRRNAAIQEKYNFEMDMVTFTDEATQLGKVVRSGEDIYDAVIMFNNNVPGIVTKGYLVETQELTYIDRSKPWWDDAVNSLAIDNKNYLLAGDLLILDNEATNALLFNKKLMEAYSIDLPYELVKSGQWTFDKLSEMTKSVSKDLDGDGQMTEVDQWGFYTYNDTMHALLVSGGGALALKDNDDIPYMSFANDRGLQIIEKAMDILYDSGNVFNISALSTKMGSSAGQIGYDSFSGGRVLFFWARMRVVEAMRNMEDDFGIIPLPKYDENQAEYYSVVNPYTGVLIGIPKSATDLDRTGIILEALSAESRYTLKPAYYDVALTRKFTRDDESSEMLDIIFNSRTYDIGAVYSFGNVFLDFITLAEKQNRNVVSYYEKSEKKMQTAIDKAVETVRNLN